MEQDQEREWVRLARGGDSAAYACLIDRYWDRLHRWLMGLSGQRQLAEDLTQEAFLRAWRAFPKLKTDPTFRVWLFRIARNCFLDEKRGPRGRAPVALPATVPGRDAGPLEQVIDAETRRRLQAALARLPSLYRAAYLLWTQEEMPYPEIARILGIRQETARWRVCKARQMLVKELKTYLDRSMP